MAEGLDTGRVDDATARRLWWAALETIQAELLLAPEACRVVSGSQPPYLRFTTPTCSLDSRDGFGPRINSS